MYEPCWECRQRYGRDYSKECDDNCGYASEVKMLKNRIKDMDSACAKAHELIGQLIDKPNSFDTSNGKIPVLAPGLDRIFINSEDGCRVESLAERTGKSNSEVVSEALKHYGDLMRIAELMVDLPNS